MTRLRREFNNDSVQVVRVARGIYSQGDNKTVDAAQFGGEAATADDRYPIAFVYGKKLKKGPESYEDVRGLVTADYQTYLEKQWVSELRKKADIRIDEAVLSTVKPL
jgi:peptidyl-prolyl cis-trans isomerase SurA